jgi:hypothetical protein
MKLFFYPIEAHNSRLIRTIILIWFRLESISTVSPSPPPLRWRKTSWRRHGVVLKFAWKPTKTLSYDSRFMSQDLNHVLSNNKKGPNG